MLQAGEQHVCSHWGKQVCPHPLPPAIPWLAIEARDTRGPRDMHTGRPGGALLVTTQTPLSQCVGAQVGSIHHG